MSMRRHFVRIPFQSSVFLICRDKTHDATLVDISMTGALLHCQNVQAVQGDCRLTIPLSSDVVLSFRAEVLHCSDGQLGCRFTGMSPATFAHLLRLLELNVGDGGQIERELQVLARQSRPAPAAPC
jgi:crotonobetainyl-CoA:carnitine CoA-transferase CaiB-like acyl-CoA transferase